jgi:hypothetical protein
MCRVNGGLIEVLVNDLNGPSAQFMLQLLDGRLKLRDALVLPGQRALGSASQALGACRGSCDARHSRMLPGVFPG